jgi:aspartate/methionine/tyrosine aminotransferase
VIVPERIAGLRPTAVNRVLVEARQLQAEGRTLVSLMRGQPDTPTPAPIVAAAEKALREGLTGYPDNQGEPILRRAIAEKLARDNGLSYDPAREILVTDGATAGIFLALAVLIQPGDDVLLPDPIYDAYSSPIAIWGGRPVPVARLSATDASRSIARRWKPPRRHVRVFFSSTHPGIRLERSRRRTSSRHASNSRPHTIFACSAMRSTRR